MGSIEGYSLALPMEEERGGTTDLASLVSAYSRLLFRVAYSVLRRDADAEEVVQDAFVRVLERVDTLGSVRDQRVWLVRIAWNLALDRRRRIRPEQMDDALTTALAAPGVPADRALEEAQRMRLVMDAIDRLPKDERQALLLSAVDELGTAELAAVLGRSESAVRALLFRARTRLRERLAKGGVR